MANIQIITDGTITGTKLTVDGKDVTKKDEVVSIYLSASSPYKSKYSGETYGGNVYVSYTSDKEGIAETKTYGTSETNYKNSIGKKLQDGQKVEDQIIRFIGREADTDICTMVDSIISHCEENKIACPDKDTLSIRSIESLKDKMSDLGIKLED